MSEYIKLRNLKGNSALELEEGSSRLLICLDMGGRVFAEVAGISPHRIDLQAAACPGDDFNNYGGNNLWPAPEGGIYGFNYRGDEWYVQPAINMQPFEVVTSKDNNILEGLHGNPKTNNQQLTTNNCARRELPARRVHLQKKAALLNRAGTVVETVIRREIGISDCPGILKGYALEGCLAYTTVDSFQVANEVKTDAALLSAWTLEQFQATPDTVAFSMVANPERAINFDYYEHPGERITYREKGFTYVVDGRCRGQIGIKVEARADWIGFYDLARRLLCLRCNRSDSKGLYFNMADNDQPDGPLSAADNYSIFNSDSDMAAFELETVGSAKVNGGLLQGSELISDTVLAVFKKAEDIKCFIRENLGQ